MSMDRKLLIAKLVATAVMGLATWITLGIIRDSRADDALVRELQASGERVAYMTSCEYHSDRGIVYLTQVAKDGRIEHRQVMRAQVGIPQRLQWSPDGRFLYVLSRERYSPYYASGQQEKAAEIHRIDVEHGTTRTLVGEHNQHVYHDAPARSAYDALRHADDLQVTADGRLLVQVHKDWYEIDRQFGSLQKQADGRHTLGPEQVRTLPSPGIDLRSCPDGEHHIADGTCMWGSPELRNHKNGDITLAASCKVVTAWYRSAKPDK